MATELSKVQVKARVRVMGFNVGEVREIALSERVAALIDTGKLELLQLDGRPVPR